MTLASGLCTDLISTEDGTGDGASVQHGTGTPGIGIRGSMTPGTMMPGTVLGAIDMATGAAIMAVTMDILIIMDMDTMAGAVLITDISSTTGGILTAGPELAECLQQAMLAADSSEAHLRPEGQLPEMSVTGSLSAARLHLQHLGARLPLHA